MNPGRQRMNRLLILLICLVLVIKAWPYQDTIGNTLEKVERFYKAVTVKNQYHENFIEEFINHESLLIRDTAFYKYADLFYELVKDNPQYTYQLCMYYRFCGLYEFLHGNVGGSIYYLDKFRATAHQYEYRIEEELALLNLMSMYTNLNDYKKALQYFEMFVPLLEAFPDKAYAKRFTMDDAYNYIIAACTGIIINIELDDTAFARKSMQLLEDIFQALSHKPIAYEPAYELWKGYYIIGKICYLRIDPDPEPDMLYEQLMESSEKVVSHRPGQKRLLRYDGLHRLMNYHRERNDLARVKRLLRDFEQVNIDLKNGKDREKLYVNYAWIHEKEHRFEEANRYQKLLYEYKDSLLRANDIRHVNAAKAMYELKDVQQLLFEQEIVKKNQASNFQKLQAMVIMLVLLTIIICYLIFSRQRKQYYHDRLYLAQSIHDEVSPLLSYLRLSLAHHKEQNTVTAEVYEDLHQQLTKISTLVREMSHEIKSFKKYNTRILEKDIRDHLDIYKSVSRANYELVFKVPFISLNFLQFQRIKMIIYEMVSNTQSHGRCNKIILHITWKKNMLNIYYTDNGIGIDETKKTNGIGLNNIQYHVQVLKGKYELHNDYPLGYYYNINIPLS